MFEFEYKDLYIAHSDSVTASSCEPKGNHLHLFYEFILCVSGSATFFVEQKSKNLEPGDFVIVLPGKYHHVLPIENNNFEKYIIHFPKEWIPEYLKPRVFQLGDFLPQNAYIASALEHIDAAMNLFENEDLYTLCKCKIIEALLFLVNRKMKFEKIKENDAIQKILNYLYIHLKENLTIQQIASDLNYSPSYIQSEFKKKMNCPLMKYFHSKKIFFAQSQLKKGIKPIEISKDLGFENYSTFYRTYVKVLGFAPTLDPANIASTIKEKNLQENQN